MSFDVTADAYARFMGRFSTPLATEFADKLAPRRGQRALDVGCGPGALTQQLVDRLGADAVSAVDPSESFVASVRDRFPGVDVRTGVAEDLPFPDDAFDLVLAQLVVHFMTDPVTGLAEMGRVTRRGGRVAANVWDHGGSSGPLATFWRAARDVDPAAPDESGLPGTREGHLGELAAAAGLRDTEPSALTVRIPFTSFEEWWEPFTFGVGPAGSYVASLDETGRALLTERCRDLLPSAPFEITATAWCVVATP